ncbi:hypothetical protein UlMin_007018 [Ulmus minor]
MEGHHHHLYQQQHQNQLQNLNVSVDVTDRFPQWSLQETEFLIIKDKLDQNFMETKRNKLLWEGCKTMEAEVVRQQLPFYNELQAIFTNRMQRIEAFEARENKRRIKEMEWRQLWKEEQRRIREEAMVEKRDALIIALLNKLRRDDM